MGCRILADENVERATVNYLQKLGHDVDRLDEIAELGQGAEDESIARYAREHGRLILTQDDDFFTELGIEATAGVLFQKTRRYRRAMWATSFTGCRDTWTSRRSSSNTSAGTGCEQRSPRVGCAVESGTRICPQSSVEVELIDENAVGSDR